MKFKGLIHRRSSDIEPLEPTFEHITREQFDMVKQVSIAQLTGYMRSFSAYVTERKANPKGEDPAVRLERDLGAVLEAHPGQLELVQCLTLIKGFKPQQ